MLQIRLALVLALVSLATGLPLPLTAQASAGATQLESELRARKTELQENLVRMGEQVRGKDHAAAEKWAASRDIIRGFDIALGLLDRAKNAEPALQDRLVFSAQQISDVLLANIENLKDLGYQKDYLIQRLKPMKVGGRSNHALPEASNLVDPSTGKILSQSELERLRATGLDLSLLQPAPETDTIDLEPSVSERVPNPEGQVPSSLYQGISISFPDKPVGSFKEFIYSQTKPKMKVKVKLPNGESAEVKLKLGLEVRSEVTASVLAGMLGFHTDRVRHYPIFRMHLGKTTLDDFRRQWLEYYEKRKFEDFVVSTGTDEKGTYIDFKSVLLELRDLDELIRAGGWAWNSKSLQARREFRALAIFQAWIQNSDLKNENNKLIIRDTDIPSVHFMVHDLGVSFGKYMAEAVLSYEENPVDSVSNQHVTLRFNPNSDLSFVTYSDARWMLRRIARLSREQISQAVDLGYWAKEKPHDVRGLLIERLIQRRNHLLKAFDLLGTRDSDGTLIQDIPVNIGATQGVLPLSGNKVDVVDYGPEFSNRIFKPLMQQLGKAIWDLGESIVGAVGSATLDPSWLGIDSSVITEVIISRDRTFVRNPEPISSEDTYIVKDDYKIGLRLGAGFVVSGDIAYVREHSILFTARDEDHARFAPGMKVGLTESYDEVARRLPKNHLYLRSDYLEGRGRLKFQPLGLVSPLLSQSLSRIRLWRGAVIAKSGRPVQTFVDREAGYAGAIGLYTNLFLWKVPHAGLVSGKFDTNRKIYDLSHLDTASALRASNAVLFFGDLEAVEKLKATRLETVQRRESKSYWSLLGLVDSQNKKSTETLQAYRVTPKGQAVALDTIFKHKRESSRGWRFLTDGETFKRSYLYQSREMTPGSPKEEFVDARILIRDNSTKTRELSRQYLQAIDMVAGEPDFLKFTPEIHEGISNNWGSLDVVMRSSYSKEALDRIAALNLNTLIRQFSLLTGISVETLRGYLSELQSRRHHSFGKGGGAYVPPSWFARQVPMLNRTVPLGDSLKKIRSFANQLLKIRKSSTPEMRGSLVMDAIFENTSGGLGFINPIIFTLIHRETRAQERYFSVYISPQQFTENKLPGGLIFTRTDGGFSSAASEELSIYNFEDALRVYHAFFGDKTPFEPLPASSQL